MYPIEECQRVGLLVGLAVLAACAQTPKSPSDPAPRDTAGGRMATGATQSLDSKQLKTERGAQGVEELIQGRFAGVEVVRLAGGGFSLRIRGAGSFMSSNEPLYVLDGVPLPQAPGGALVGVAPHDIERIEVLKDASSTALYGVRGANGVILITTKRGKGR
jgi:TonB-dependent SusC/RagA subfamily outer membrane receptor